MTSGRDDPFSFRRRRLLGLSLGDLRRKTTDGRIACSPGWRTVSQELLQAGEVKSKKQVKTTRCGGRTSPSYRENLERKTFRQGTFVLNINDVQ